MQDIFRTVLDVTDGAIPAEDLAPLRAALERLRAEQPQDPAARVRSQRGGTRVYLDAAFADGPELATLRARLAERAHALTQALRGSDPQSIAIAKIWADWLPDGGHHHVHVHEGASWACVFTVDAADCEGENGALWLVDPRPGAYVLSKPGFGQRFPNIPVPSVTNRLVVFPGWVPHYVASYRGTGERLAIALNLRL